MCLEVGCAHFLLQRPERNQETKTYPFASSHTHSGNSGSVGKESGHVCLALPATPQSTDSQKFSPETMAVGWKLGDLVPRSLGIKWQTGVSNPLKGVKLEITFNVWKMNLMLKNDITQVWPRLQLDLQNDWVNLYQNKRRKHVKQRWNNKRIRRKYRDRI